MWQFSKSFWVFQKSTSVKFWLNTAIMTRKRKLQVKALLGAPAFHIQVPVQLMATALLLMYLERQEVIAKFLGHDCPCGRPSWSFWLLPFGKWTKQAACLSASVCLFLSPPLPLPLSLSLSNIWTKNIECFLIRAMRIEGIYRAPWSVTDWGVTEGTTTSRHFP